MENKWIQGSVERMKEKGTQGSFTRLAEKHGQSPKSFASHVMANKDDFPAKTVKKANWLMNVVEK